MMTYEQRVAALELRAAEDELQAWERTLATQAERWELETLRVQEREAAVRAAQARVWHAADQQPTYVLGRQVTIIEDAAVAQAAQAAQAARAAAVRAEQDHRRAQRQVEQWRGRVTELRQRLGLPS
jgi:hypothetical protein